jgi:hypothetical protein
VCATPNDQNNDCDREHQDRDELRRREQAAEDEAAIGVSTKELEHESRDRIEQRTQR